jgi:hypothetical protein
LLVLAMLACCASGVMAQTVEEHPTSVIPEFPTQLLPGLGLAVVAVQMAIRNRRNSGRK